MDNKSIVAIEETENNDALEDLCDFGGSQLRRAHYSHYAPSVRSFGALEEDSHPTLRLVVVGDRVVGKTELLITYATNKFPSVYVPTVFENNTVTVMIGDEPYTLKLIDTSFQEDYDRLRPLSYPQTDVFLVCFSVASPISFKNCKEKWIPEITYHCPGVPFILVGTKCQLRDDPKIFEQLRKDREAPVAKTDGIALAERMGAVRYLECDALTHYNVKNVFDEAIVAALEPQKKTSHILRRFNLFRKPNPTTSVDTK